MDLGWFRLVFLLSLGLGFGGRPYQNFLDSTVAAQGVQIACSSGLRA